MEVDYQGGGSYKRKYRVREIIAKGPFDLFFRNEQVRHAVSVVLHAGLQSLMSMGACQISPYLSLTLSVIA